MKHCPSNQFLLLGFMALLLCSAGSLFAEGAVAILSLVVLHGYVATLLPHGL
jgi:hypothetical protein